MARVRRLVVGCLLALVVLGGCRGGGDDDAAPSTTAGGAASPGPTTTVRPVDTSFTGQNSAQFCALAKTYEERFRNVNAASTPAQLRTATQEGRTAINQAVTAAPAEIKPDVQVLATAFGTFFTELERVGFDATRVTAAAFAPLQAPDFQASSARFQAYLRSVCGLG